jgi:phospholipid/cholesterol/gamma-HCH transport system permease protein
MSSTPPTLDEMLGLDVGDAPSALMKLRGVARDAADVLSLGKSAVRSALRGRAEPGATAEQMHEIGNRSFAFLCIAMGFIGMIFVYQAGLQIRRIIPDVSQIGATYLELLVRDLASTLCALLLATRVGAGIAAEIGSMVVTEQVDALRMCAADPVDYLVRPRFLASLVMTTVLTVIAGCTAYLSGMWTAQASFGINPRTFVDPSLLDASDVVVGLAKCVAYGASTPIISAHAGLSATGGSAGVGRATTRAVVNSSLAIIALDFVISAAGYLLFG